MFKGDNFESSMSSLVRISGSRTGSHCGYCCGKNGVKHSYGMWAHRLTTQDYEDLIDRGWRRSGSYCYKPLMDKMCCPPYTIRCNSLQFRLTRKQKRLIKQVHVFLNTGVKPRNTNASKSATASSRGHDLGAVSPPGGQGDVPAVPNRPKADLISVQAAGDKSGGQPDDKCAAVVSQTNQSNAARKSTETAAIPNSSGDRKCEKSRVKRWNAKLNRMKARATKENTSFDKLMEEYRVRRENRLEKSREKTFDDYMAMILPPDKAAHTLTIRLVQSCPASKDFIATKEIEHKLYQRYQVHVHGDSPASVSMKQFKNFLIDSPLMATEAGSPSVKLGSFHQQYWLDGELIAVGVIDIMPHCVSSVYLFYHPDYAFLSLGTYTALREIEFTRQLSRSLPDLHHYYMGYYIQSCPKMRYKGQFSASQLACPETFAWQPLAACRPLLDAAKYSRLDPDPAARDTDTPPGGTAGLDQVVRLAVSEEHAMPMGLVFEPDSEEWAKLDEWARLVGGRCAARIVVGLVD